jgi:hypothetical protein
MDYVERRTIKPSVEVYLTPNWARSHLMFHACKTSEQKKSANRSAGANLLSF